jgi:hypothetical protein
VAHPCMEPMRRSVALRRNSRSGSPPGPAADAAPPAGLAGGSEPLLPWLRPLPRRPSLSRSPADIQHARKG